MFPRHGYLKYKTHLLCAGCALLFTIAAFAQTPAAPAAPAASAPRPSEILHPSLDQVKQAIAGLNISRWKAPGEIRASTQQNADSIQRDLNSVLPGLLAQADAAPGSATAVFPVYRNIDALYDVLLRISQTANMTAPQNEAASIVSALDKLESARTQLADSILTSSRNTESKLANLQAAVQKAAAAQNTSPPKTIIVDNAPAKSTTRHRKKTTNSSNPPANPSNTSAPSSPQ
jgi:hypothetical protein